MTSKIPARLKLPVRCVDGQWEFALGGAVPVSAGMEKRFSWVTKPISRRPDSFRVKETTLLNFFVFVLERKSTVSCTAP